MAPAKASGTATEAPPTGANPSPGMATLLGGGKDKTPSPTESSETEPIPGSAKARNRKWIGLIPLFVADGLLLALTALLAWKGHSRLGRLELGLCVIAVAVGAWLSCLAIFRAYK